MAIIPPDASRHTPTLFLNTLPWKCSYFHLSNCGRFFFFFSSSFSTRCLHPSRMCGHPNTFFFLPSFFFFFFFLKHPSCIFAHHLLPADLVVVVQWSGLSICSQPSTYIDLCHCVYALDQLLFTIHEIPAKKSKQKNKKKVTMKHLHNVVECPLTQMRNQGSCFQINTYCFKKKLNGKQCFLLYPLAVLSILFGLVLFFLFFLFWLQVLLVSFTPTYVFSYFWLNKFYIICFELCHLLFIFDGYWK